MSRHDSINAATARDVYNNRRIDRAHEYDLVRRWQDQFVAPPGSNPFHKGGPEPPTTFRLVPDSAWPPPSQETQSVPPQPTDPYILSFTTDTTGGALLYEEPLRTVTSSA